MNYAGAWGLYAAVGAGAAAFVLISGASLPPVVASHFAATGAANGFMPRQAYLALLLSLTLAVPLLLALPYFLLTLVPPRLINLPNRDYWLAPERSDETIRFVREHSLWVAALVLLFLCFVHRLVVDANALQPPHLSVSSLIMGLVAFILGMAVWLAALIAHFRQPK